MKLILDKTELKKYASDKRYWQGIPAVEVTKKGRIFSAWYSGQHTEQLGNYSLLVRSDDGGATFSEPVAVAFLDMQHRCYDPCLWIDPKGRLWFIWAVGPDHAVWASVCNDPDDDELIWTEPKIIGHDVMMNKPIVTSDNRWLFPIAVWRRELTAGIDMSGSAEEDRRSFVYESVDEGETFRRIGGSAVPDRWYDEHMVVEKKDRSLWMLVRVNYGIGQSFSYDGGKTWEKDGDSGLGGPNSRFCIRRLPSGNLLLVNHVGFTGRSHLTAMISRDDGATWEGYLLLDGRSDVSYPDAAFHGGSIYIVYDHERGAAYRGVDYTNHAREILMAKITEEDILAGKLVTEGSFLQGVVNKLNTKI